MTKGEKDREREREREREKEEKKIVRKDGFETNVPAMGEKDQRGRKDGVRETLLTDLSWKSCRHLSLPPLPSFFLFFHPNKLVIENIIPSN